MLLRVQDESALLETYLPGPGQTLVDFWPLEDNLDDLLDCGSSRGHRHRQQQRQQRHLAGVMQDALEAAVATIGLKRPLPKTWCGSALPSTPW